MAKKQTEDWRSKYLGNFWVCLGGYLVSSFIIFKIEPSLKNKGELIYGVVSLTAFILIVFTFINTLIYLSKKTRNPNLKFPKKEK